MRILANREIRRLFTALALIWALAMLLTAGWAWLYCRRLTPWPVLIPLLAGGGASLIFRLLSTQTQVFPESSI